MTDKLLPDGRIECAVVITGTYKGQSFTYTDTERRSQYIWPAGEEDRVSRFWWSMGNMACDCNRDQFLPPEMAKDLPRDADGGVTCGQTICIDSIVPLDTSLPALQLNETLEKRC